MNTNRMSLTSYGVWDFKGFLGSGAFGEVHHWKHKLTGQEIVTKRLKPNPKLRPDEINILHKRWSQEYQWMRMLTTECIVAAVEIDDKDFLQYLIRQSHVEHTLPIILMEYCNGGDLRSHLNIIQNRNGLVEYEVRSILYTLKESIKYLHRECNIEHRDIKPENIVLHVTKNHKIYKLTDFGYAREIPENTVAQSVVGTRNYVAPEVIDPGCYTQTVDYWSAGHVAYESICGTLPFIPHQNFVKRLEAIRAKPSKCIQIVQKVDDPFSDDIEFEFGLPCNRCSPLFNDHIQRWLSLTLDKNYKTRGFDDFGELKFYSLLEEILNKKILTVFSLKKCKKYYYDIESFTDLQALIEQLASDNEIDIKNLFLITPPLHPKKHFKRPSDYFVPEWCDTNRLENPPVMLFVNEFINQGACNIDVHTHFKPSATIVKCMNVQDADIPPWLLQQFEREVHFILSDKQEHLTCYMMGLQQFVMQVQHEVFFYKNTVSELNEKVLLLAGNIQLFSTVIDETKQLKSGDVQEAAIEMEVKDFLTKTKKYCNFIESSYRSISKECKKLAEDEFYKQAIEEDMFLIKEYRAFLSQVISNREGLIRTQHYFENCVQKFITFLSDNKSKRLKEEINNVIKKYISLKCAVFKIKNEISDVTKKVDRATRSLLKDLHTNNVLSSRMDTLNIDAENPSASISTNSLTCDSMTLINNSLQLMDVINNQCHVLNSLPWPFKDET